MKNKVYIINGPNLNRLGRRAASIYGTATLQEIEVSLQSRFGMRLEMVFFQNNSEGRIIDALQQAADDDATLGIVINPGAYAHYSYAIADALADLQLQSIPVIEVHISNIAAREDFRRKSVTAVNCMGMISGFGIEGYSLAVQAISNTHRNNEC